MSDPSIDLFLQACGRAEPLQLSVECPRRQEDLQRTLREPFALIGRDPRADVLLDHPHVSGRHAYLQLLAGRLFCVDLQSRTGTHWEAGPKRSGWLNNQQAIRIGPFWIRLMHSGCTGAPAAVGESSLSMPQPHAESELPDVTLEFVNRSPQALTWPMTGRLALVGHAPDCRVNLVARSVSKFHCSLVRTPMGVWVIDLFGRGGTWVNEQPVRCTRLEDGDCLRVGKFLICLRYNTPPLSKPHQDLAATGTLSLGARESERSLPTAPENLAEPLEVYDQGFTGEVCLPTAPENLAEPSAEPMGGAVPAPAPEKSALDTVVDASADAPRSANRGLTLLPVEAHRPTAATAESLLPATATQLSMLQQQMFDQFQQAMMMMFQMFNSLQREQIGVIRDEMQRLHELAQEVRTLQAELASRTQPAQDRPLANPPATAPWGAGLGGSMNRPGPRSSLDSQKRVAAEPGALPQAQVEGDVHAWLRQRIAAIEQERQSGWQKIVGFLTAKAATPSPCK